ncbi:uncharacterized protein TA09040 [Theileria annulata]|uniref:Cleavage stimulation factor subunit 2 hinge domain-containing protein n=1 Tax=Theileria annulata TaxID=5874 RepID=Q4U9B8_THEAN|nr:uncharacterized protein TA09040 [Theileria annulata]CAI76585.1 hypothetical protein TA09040 [Theileria annulata]|eukprot:XP_953210.1 hypothetical protein TA09040 [Theileria annulata]
MVIPPPPPPPPKHIPPSEMGKMVEGYDQEGLKMGVVVPHDSYGTISAPTYVPSFIPQPPAVPPQSGGVHPMGIMNPSMGLMVPPMTHQPGHMPAQLIDPYLAAEISSIVHTLSTSQLIYVLAALKKFLKHAPSEARRFLINNPQLTYALLHTQFILGEHDESVLPLSKLDHDISQVNRLERSGHLKPFHNLYEDNSNVQHMEEYNIPDQYQVEQYQVPYQPPQHIEPVVNEKPMHQPMHQPMQHPVSQTPPQQLTHEATQKDIDDLMNSGIYPASAALVDEVIKNNDILTHIQKANMVEMNSWPPEQKQQVLSIKVVSKVVVKSIFRRFI